MEIALFCRPDLLSSELQGPALADFGSLAKSWEFPRVWWCPAYHQTLGNSQQFLGEMEPLVVLALHDKYEERALLSMFEAK